MESKLLLIAVLVLFLSLTAAATISTEVVEFTTSDFLAGEAGSALSSDPGQLPTLTRWYRVESGRFDSLNWNATDYFSLGQLAPNGTEDITTFAGDDLNPANHYDELLRDNLDKAQPVLSWQRMFDGDQELVLVTISALQPEPENGDLIVAGSIELHWCGDEALQITTVTDVASPALNSSSRRSSTALTNNSPEYLIVTSAELVEAFEPLRLWKQLKGLRSEIVTMDEVLASSSGVDDAAQLRDYLIYSYYQGVDYVLLGGDEEIIPIRYAYHRNSDEMPTKDLLQICDLYYADLTGDWDADGDGLYGEPLDDEPDLVPEIRVGRVPANTAEEVQRFVTKLIAYEQNPGGGEYDYLQRSLFIAADQMRDYHDVGEHTLLAEALPSTVTADLSSLIEAPSGKAETPSAPAVDSALEQLNDGWGMISLLIHGIPDGWVLRSHDYNQWPKSYIYTGPGAAGDHGYLPTYSGSQKPGVIYSVGCSNGAFDTDTQPWFGQNPCIAEAFLQQQSGGAIAFIGYSRWGWVSSSWKLERSFLEYIYQQDGNLADALRHSKLDYPNYRDLAYGLNLYGDPETEMWTTAPAQLSIVTPEVTSLGYNEVTITVRNGALPCLEALVSIVANGEIIAQMSTDANGIVSAALDYHPEVEYEVIAYKEGHATATTVLTPAISLDVDDDQYALPDKFSLEQNFPNPFNPTTQIVFNLARSAHVELEVFNLLGQRVAVLADEWLSAGSHQVGWDGRNDDGEAQPSGLYFARLAAAEQSDVIKMSLLK